MYVFMSELCVRLCVQREGINKIQNCMSKITQVIGDYQKRKDEVSMKECQRMLYDN